jgi:hypothetical protein
MVVRDIEREDIEFISKTLGCLPVAHIDHLRPEKLGAADLVEEVEVRGAVVRGVRAGWVGVSGSGSGCMCDRHGHFVTLGFSASEHLIVCNEAGTVF